jgi:hypothetical protein
MAIVNDKKILEYALKGLEAERDVIETQIMELRRRLSAAIAPTRRPGPRPSAETAKKRRGRAIKGVEREVARAVKAGKKKARKMTAAQRKLISKRMKEAWARRKAAEK